MCYNMFVPIGIVQIMVGLFNIGLGPGRTSMNPGDLTDLEAAYWFGAVFIAVGIVSVLADFRRSYYLVYFSVFMNVVGFVFGIIACVLYSVDLSQSSFQWECDNSDNCRYVAYFAQKMLMGQDITLIVMAGLQVWGSITLTVSGIRSFCFMKEKSIKDVEIQKPLLKSDLLTIY